MPVISYPSDDDQRTVEPFLDGLYFGECPRWKEDRLWYVDFYDGTVWSAGIDRDARVELILDDDEPAGLGWMPDGRLLVAARLERVVLRVEPDGRVVRHGNLRPWATWHSNDMVVDSTGRAYVGNFGFDLDAVLARKPGAHVTATSIVRIDTDGTAREVATNLLFPNGAVITADSSTLLVAETFASCLTAFDLSSDGTLSNRRVWAAIPGCMPDGLCLDAEGCVWVANAVAGECLRVAEGGYVLDRVGLEQSCFACMLGGYDRRTLFMMVANSGVSSVARARRTGRIVMTRVSVPGAGLP